MTDRLEIEQVIFYSSYGPHGVQQSLLRHDPPSSLACSGWLLITCPSSDYSCTRHIAMHGIAFYTTLHKIAQYRTTSNSPVGFRHLVNKTRSLFWRCWCLRDLTDALARNNNTWLNWDPLERPATRRMTYHLINNTSLQRRISLAEDNWLHWYRWSNSRQ